MKLNRRTVLKVAGVSLALPWLEAATARVSRAEVSPPPKRLVCVCTPLGLHTPSLYPTKSGKDYELTPYLEILKKFRDQFTVISGLSHPEVESGHDSIFSYLTAAPHPELRAGFRNTISLDQLAAEQIGEQTRVPSLVLSAEGFSLSWTRSGALVPSETSPSHVFKRLFMEGSPHEVEGQIRRLRDGQSILDQVGEQAKSLQAGLSSGDREKLEEYFGSVRELERRMVIGEQWSRKPKPKVEVPPPQDVTNNADLVGRTRLLFDLTHLALQTDSTRLVTIILLGSSQVPPIPGVSDGHHNLSHHGQDAEKLKQLGIVELEKLKTLRDFLAKLNESKEGGGSLLQNTSVMFGSNLGNANNHSCKNLPVLLAGGGFQHGQHLAFDPAKPPPLSNLYVSLLQKLGIEADKFGSSTGTLTGLT